MSATAKIYGMGGTPRENAALAMVMFATAATPHGEAAGVGMVTGVAEVREGRADGES